MSLLQSMKSILIPIAGVALGCAAALAVIETRSQEHKRLQSQLEEFRNLDAEQQKMVKASYAEFNLQTADRKNEIIALHKAVQAAPELNQELERYFAWWSSLSRSEWDSFPDMNREQQIAFAKARINKRTESSAVVVVEFTGRGQMALQPLHLRLDEYERIINRLCLDSPIPGDVTEEVNQLSSPEHKALANSFWLFEQFKNATDREEVLLRSEKILKDLMTDVSDDAWRNQFQQIIKENSDRRFFKFWMFQNLLVILKQSTMVLGHKLQAEFPVSDEEIVAAFANLSDKERQYSLMTMPSDEARSRLEFLAQLNRPQTPEQKLLVEFIAFARDQQRVIGAILFQLGDRPQRNGDGNALRRDQDNK